MAKILSFHAFRADTGKSNIVANVAGILGSQGRRIGVIDANIQLSGLYHLFGLKREDIQYSLNDYLWGNCEIRQASLDVTAHLPGIGTGQIFLVPSSVRMGEVVRIMREGFDTSLFVDGFQRLVKDLDLDILMIHTQPGLSRENLLSIEHSDTVGIVMRPEQRDFEGSALIVEIARKLKVKRTSLIVNNIPSSLDLAALSARIGQAFDCEVAGMLSHSEDLMAMGNSGIFALQYPDHPLTADFKKIAAALVG